MRKYILAILLIACPAPGMANGINQRLDDLFGKHAEYREFHKRLVEAVGNDDRPALADMMHYPLRRNHNGMTAEYHSKADFIKNYPAIFNQAVRAAVLGQDFAEIFANYEGIMYGRGELWAAELCIDHSPCDTCHAWAIRVYSINTP